MKKLWSIIFLLYAIFPIHGQANGQYLVAGVGLNRVLEIGQQMEADSRTDTWNDHKSGLQFKVNNQNIIVLIKCQNSRYPTDRNVRVGSPEKDVTRWYGAAREKRQVSGGILYSYLGISFAIINGQVEIIYIFPRYLLKK
jgi:hypothetical protein